MNNNQLMYLNTETTTIHKTLKGDLLSIFIGDHEFKPNEDGLWNLNEIWKTLELPKKKRPNQWRDVVSKKLSEAANLQSGEYFENNLKRNTLLATEEATIAYAMWVSVDFYMMVVKAFLNIRLQAVNTAKRDESKAKAFNSKLINHGATWTETCKVAGIQHPKLAIKYMLKVKAFTQCPFESTIRPSQNQIKKMNFKITRNQFNKEGYRVLLNGFNRLQELASEINQFAKALKHDKEQGGY